MLLAAALALSAGQVAKFEGRAPEVQYLSRTPLEEVERCLIRIGSPPQVYRQPDRPDDVMIVWTASGVAAGNAAARVDLNRSQNGTAVRAWLSGKAVEACAPR